MIFCLLFCSISAAGLSEEAEIDQNALPQEVQQIIDENGYTGVCETNKEDACSITFTKDDDSKVLYIYDAPVK